MNSNARNDDVAALVAGALDLSTVAARHQTTEATVAEWRSVFIAGMRASRGGGRALSLKTWRTRLAAAAAVLVAVLASREALAAVCAGQPSLPNGLVVMCPNTPALALDFNNNLKQITDWMIAKTGPLTDPNLTSTGTISAKGYSGGPVSALSFTSSGSMNVGTTLTTGGSATVNALISNTSSTARSFNATYSDWNASTLQANAAGGILSDNAQYKTLMIAGNTAVGNGFRYITLYDNVTVSGNSTVTGALYAKARPVVLDVTACNTGSEGNNCCPSGYAQDGQDLNQGASGKFIYLCRLYAN
jgi:hypothetical protein